MSLGHGAPGFLSGLRCFSDLIDEDGADRRPYLELRLGNEMTAGSWLFYQTGTYRQRAHFVIDGVLRDIVAVVASGSGLTRVESIAACAATAGTYYFSGEDAVLLGAPSWDDGSNVWDIGSNFWDLFPPAELYVHLAGDADPNNFTMMAYLGFYYSSRGDVHPNLGPEVLLNGGFETGADSISATNWTITTPAGSSFLRDTVIVKKDTRSGKFTTNGSVTVSGQPNPAPVLVVGRRYRLSGYYLTPSSNAAAFAATIKVGSIGGGVYVNDNGRDYNTTGAVPTLAPTVDTWRRFLFDFVAPTAGPDVLIAGAAGAGSLYLDDVSLKRIWRYSFFEPRIADDSVPEVMTACGRWFGTQTMGLSSISLLNGSGVDGGQHFEGILGQLRVEKKPVLLAVGGRFLDGSEVYRDEHQPRFAGLIDKHTVSDERAVFELQDWRTFLKTQIPRNLYDQSVEQRSIGVPRPIMLGTAMFDLNPNFISRPTRISSDPTTGYGIYELLDGTLGSVAGGSSDINVTSWIDEQSADKAAPNMAITPPSAAFSYATTGRLTILLDVRPIVIPATLYIDFSRNGTQYVGNFAPPTGSGPFIYRIDDWCSYLQSNMRTAAGAGGITVTYDNTTHKVTIADPSATVFQLLVKTGANVAVGAWKFLGFDSGSGLPSDLAGALTYTGQNALFVSADKDHVIRVTANGYLDDSVGTFTGVASARLKYPSDVAMFLISKALGVPATVFDSSFTNHDHTGLNGYEIYVYVDTAKDSDAVLATIEQAAMAAIVMTGDGIFHWTPYSDATSRRTFYDRDYLSFSCARATSDVASNMRLFYPAQPNQEAVLVRTLPASRDWPQVQPFIDIHACLRAGASTYANIPTVADKYMTIASARPREVTFTARGKLADLKVADLITLNRARGLDATGALASVKFRILSLSHNDSAGIARCTALEYIPA